ncbi:MAG: di-heme-cytochrome C peroxidase, partial [Gammaproteobacteria bacterium]
VYKGRPLNGIWATAPYLHNGSVPNLYEILLPATERSKTFYLGSREYDPIKVGFNSDASSTLPNAFKFDTSRLGNSNSGHEYGVHELNRTEKQELLEYMKTL